MAGNLELNPWLSILTSPRKTIRQIVEYDPNYRLIILSAIYGFSALLGIAQNLKLGDKLDVYMIIIPAIILAPLWGYILFSVSSWFILFTGKWLGGKATFKQVRAATAWANVPSIVNVLMWILLMIAFGSSLFQDVVNKTALPPGKIFVVFSIMLVQLVASIWSLVIYINAIAEVHMFSILRAIFNIIIAMIIVGIISFIIFSAVKWTCGAFFDQPLLVFFDTLPKATSFLISY